MKINTSNFLFFVLFLLFLVACSTKKDSFLSRNSHALSTKYNILYNGQIGFDKGVASVKANTKDNFWKRLPIEIMQVNDELIPGEKPKNADFELAETKATKAIQKHSMNIDGREKNTQIDEAYLLLGKSRYYDQRFIPALDAFNYILYKYPNSNNIYEARIWKEKTNLHLGNDANVINNLEHLLEDYKPKKQIFADGNAILAEAFLNLEEKDSAVTKLKLAEKNTSVNNEKARYRFILGQLYEELGKIDSALYFYQTVIDLNRKVDRKYIIQSYAKRASYFDYQNGDMDLFVKRYKKIMKDRENHAFLDVIYYHMGIFYDKNNNEELATEFYNASLMAKSADPYLVASTYRNLGNMHFKRADYQNAAKYYDSTLVKLDNKSREFYRIDKTRKNLDEVIKLEDIATRNDSIIKIVSLPEADRKLYFENYIAQLKEADKAKKISEEKLKAKLAAIEQNSKSNLDNQNPSNQQTEKTGQKTAIMPPANTDAATKEKTSLFYFYNPTTVAYGKLEFRKTWGDRSLSGNWRLSSNKTEGMNAPTSDTEIAPSENKIVEEKENKEYNLDYYVNQLPESQAIVDSIVKERNFAYFQLGIIYKEKFKENQLASDKLEKLLQFNPEEKLVPPTMYNLYKIYQITDANKAEEMKIRISSQYPNSRYAQIINNGTSSDDSLNDTPEKVYNKYYRLYEEERFTSILEKIDSLIEQFSGDEIVSKFELLKANTIGKLYGLVEYKKAMQYVADNYPTKEEGKYAQEIITTQIPVLEKMVFSMNETKNWKIIYRINTQDNESANAIEESIRKFIADENIERLYYSCDIYTGKESFITIHGIKSEAYAKSVATLLKDNKKYAIGLPAIVISSENYKIIQIKKNLESYLTYSKQ